MADWVAWLALFFSVVAIMLVPLAEHIRKARLKISVSEPASNLLDTKESNLVWCVHLGNPRSRGWQSFTGRQSGKGVKARLDIINIEGSYRPFAKEFGDKGVELSFVELPPNKTDIWKLEDVPVPRDTSSEIVTGRDYLIPIAYCEAGKTSWRLLDQHRDRVGERELPEGNYQLYLIITGENINKRIPLILTKKGYSFHEFTLKLDH